MLNNSLVRYYWKKEKKRWGNKERLTKVINIHLKVGENMVAKDIQTVLNMKNKKWLNTAKTILKCGKTLRNNFQAIEPF